MAPFYGTIFNRFQESATLGTPMGLT